jgi:hypothetical protein
MKYHSGKSLIESLGTGSFGWGDTDIPTLLCPECGFPCNHFGNPKIIPGNDNYEANWGGRGDLLTIPIEGECGCVWEICFGFHKGSIAAYTQVIRSCRNLVDTFIYFIEAVGLSRIKIGFSKKPIERLKQLQTGSPIELSLIATIPGALELEKELHDRFKASLSSREWFHLTSELKNFIISGSTNGWLRLPVNRALSMS